MPATFVLDSFLRSISGSLLIFSLFIPSSQLCLSACLRPCSFLSVSPSSCLSPHCRSFFSSDLRDADALYSLMTRKFKQQLDIWISYGRFLFARGELDSARALLQRALTVVAQQKNAGLFVCLSASYMFFIMSCRPSRFVLLFIRFFLSAFLSLHFFLISIFVFFFLLPLSSVVSCLRSHLDFQVCAIRVSFWFEERGRTMFDRLLDQFPKRSDLWNVLLDMELSPKKKGSNAVDMRAVRFVHACCCFSFSAIPSVSVSLLVFAFDSFVSFPSLHVLMLSFILIRRVFERVIQINFSTKKMKHFFERYLAFEKQFGDESTVNHVKDAARQYVQSKMG